MKLSNCLWRKDFQVFFYISDFRFMGRVFALEFGIPPLLGEEKDKLLIREGVGGGLTGLMTICCKYT
jgi:hypothetical protein